MIQEHDTVVVNRDLKEAGIVAGDIGAVVHVCEGRDMAEVEFVTGEGTTVAVETLLSSEIRPIGRREIPHARSLETDARGMHSFGLYVGYVPESPSAGWV